MMNTDYITAPTQRTFRDYANYLFGFVVSMFEWRSDFAPDWAFERLLTTHGHCAIYRYGEDGKPVLITGGYTGAVTPYGFGEKYTGTIGEDLIVLWNNYTLSPDTQTVSAYAERYVESDKSILNVLRGTRITNLVTATDNTDSQTLNNVVNAIANGDTVVKIPPVYREIDALDNGTKRFDVMRLTDPKDTDKLQYLSRYRDDMLAAFLNEYGIDVNVVNKGSQVSKDELHSMEKAISATVKQRFDCRARDLDTVRAWGFDIDVKPNIGRADIEQDEQETGDNNEQIHDI